jgi:hypothetical protein
MTKKLTQYFKNTPKYIPVLGAFLAGVIVASIIYFVSRSSPKADDNLALRAARIERIDGDVGIAHPETQEEVAATDWEEASRNAPLTTGDRIYAREGSRAAVAFTGRNYARLDSGSALDVLSLADRRTQLALHNGSAIFDIGELEDGELFEVATPNGAFGFDEPGLYQLGIGDDGNTWISVLSGLAQVIGVEGSGEINQGEILTLVGQTAAQVLVSRFSDDYAGEIIDDYYDYRYDDYDGRYRSYTVYQDDPDYYSPYRRSTSYRYVADDIPGAYDLDDYGDWSDIDGYGHCWTPRVDSDWAPYRDGYWDVGSAYGPTWISQEAWGYAPYHYGRWAYVNQRQWVWVPERIERRAVYAPALVAFVPITRSNQIGWVPLAPGERYAPRYYDNDFQPRYYGSPEVVAQVVNVQQNYVNYNYPQAITVVETQDFTRRIDRRRLAAVNSQTFAQVQPVLDPYAIASVRNMAIANENDRPKFKMARELRKQAFNNSVVTSVAPIVIPGRENMNGGVQVATVPEKQRKNKLKMQQGGEVADTGVRPGLARQSVPQMNSPVTTQAREQQVAELAARSAQGDREARRELKRLAREQNADPQRMQNPGAVPPQVQGRELKQMNNQSGAAVNPQKAQRQLERQQRRAIEEQQRQQGAQPPQGQLREQRRAQKQAAQQAAQNTQNVQVEQRRAQKQAAREEQMNRQRQIEQLKQRQQQEQVNQQRQMKQQRKQERQVKPPQMQEQQVNQAQQQQMKQQRKQERRIQEQQVQQQQVNQRQVQEQQMRQQMKQQRRMQEQQQMQQRQQSQPPAAQQQIDRQQRKAERRAAQQQASPQVVQPQQQPRANKPVEYKGPPVNADQSQRRAEKAQRKAGKGNQ